MYVEADLALHSLQNEQHVANNDLEILVTGHFPLTENILFNFFTVLEEAK